MENVISRNLISENFIGTNLSDGRKFTKTRLVKRINFWKYILTHRCAASAGQSILIGIIDIDNDYLALCIAAAELSLKIVVVDYSRPDEFRDIEFFDPKTKLLSPIDIFLYDVPKKNLEFNECSKLKFFINCAQRAFNIKEDIDFSIDKIKYKKASRIYPKPSDIVMKCTSSGTTGTPKIVEHTHEFLYALSIRNSKKFQGKCMHTRNLNHGSSLAVYLLPALANDAVSEHLIKNLDEDDSFEDFIDSIINYKDTLQFIIFPYPFMIEKFIEASRNKEIKWTNLNVQTLSYIQDSAKQAVKDKIFRSITSIFGSNETSGPVFTACIEGQNTEQDSSLFDHTDDFYKIKIYDDGLLGVIMPIYNTEIITNDVFEQRGVFYQHKGRTDLIKINGEIVDIKIINELNNSNNKFYIVTDSVKNCLYLACWESVDILDSKNYALEIEKRFSKITVDKIAVLNKKNFFSGVKLDHELLREYFRNHVS